MRPTKPKMVKKKTHVFVCLLNYTWSTNAHSRSVTPFYKPGGEGQQNGTGKLQVGKGLSTASTFRHFALNCFDWRGFPPPTVVPEDASPGYPRNSSTLLQSILVKLEFFSQLGKKRWNLNLTWLLKWKHLHASKSNFACHSWTPILESDVVWQICSNNFYYWWGIIIIIKICSGFQTTWIL